ncbi:hypothetical protein CHUAL_002869 [Chamberlinius hualienensis]
MEEKLIEAVRVRTILYDTNHSDYMKTKLKMQTWDEVAKEIGMNTGNKAKALWEKLRHCLRDALRRQKNYINGGAAVETLKQWKFQQKMGFLLPYMTMTNRERGRELKIESDCEQSWSECAVKVNEEELKIEYENENTPDQIEPEVHIESEVLSESEVLEPEPGASRIQATIRTKKLRRDNNVVLIKQNSSKFDERATSRTEFGNNVFEGPSDQLYFFFMSMYQSTKNLPLSSQLRIRKNVFQVVQEEMEATMLNPVESSNHKNHSLYGSF